MKLLRAESERASFRLSQDRKSMRENMRVALIGAGRIGQRMRSKRCGRRWLQQRAGGKTVPLNFRRSENEATVQT
jgi:hypothetical protein